MAGPNPFRLGSFAELIFFFGPVFVICDPRQRYVGLSRREHNDRDSRTTTWSCCVCGSTGRVNEIVPPIHRDDRRENPRRHPKATARLTVRPARPSRTVQLRETPKDRRCARG